MKKTLALILSIVMVIAFAMIPASAATTSTLGWEVLNNATITKVDGNTVKMTGSGYYGQTNTAVMMVSEKEVDLTNGLKLTFADVDGITGSSDSWLVIGIVDSKEAAKAFTTGIGSGACVMFRPNSQNWTPYSINGAGCVGYSGYENGFPWENWGAGINTAFFAGVGVEIGGGAAVSFDVEFKDMIATPVDAKISTDSSATVPQIYIIGSEATFSTLYNQVNENRLTAMNNCFASLNGKGYVFVAMSNVTDTSVMSVKVEALEVDKAPATFDLITVFGAIAATSVTSACAVVRHKKKEDTL